MILRMFTDFSREIDNRMHDRDSFVNPPLRERIDTSFEDGTESVDLRVKIHHHIFNPRNRTRGCTV